MDATILGAAAINGLLLGGAYALVAVGLTLIYGVLHIINFAHGSLLMLAMYGVYFLLAKAGVDPYAALPLMVAGMFAAGYVMYRALIGRFSHGKDENILLITLGLAIVLENVALFFFTGDTQTITVSYSYTMVPLGPALVPLPKLVSFLASLVLCGALALFIARTDTGKAIRAVAKEKIGAQLAGIDVAHIYAVTFGLGTACVAIAACLLIPSYYVNPHVGNAFVLVAFTIVVLGGMGSVPGALIGGLFIGVIESLCGFYLGESLGQIGIFMLFILVLLFRPTGLFGERA